MIRLHTVTSSILIVAIAGCSYSSNTVPNIVAERGTHIVIETGKGDLVFEPRNLANGSCDGDDCVDFRRVDQAPAGYALVHKLYYEGSEWLLINTDSGAQLTLPAQPNFSPFSDRLIVINPDETGDGSGSGSFVYERGKDGAYAQLARFGMEDFAPIKFIRWADPECADVQGYIGWGKPDFDTSAARDASIARSADGRWQVTLQTCPDTSR